MWNSVTWSLAIRNLRHGMGQSLLTMAVVTMSVILVVFIGSLISGLQIRLTNDVTGAIPHIVVRQPERELQRPDDGETLYLGESVQLERRTRKIEDWQEWLERIETFDPAIIAASPVIEAEAILTREARTQGVVVSGVIPSRHNAVVDIQGNRVDGSFFEMNTGQVSVGSTLADEFRLSVGDTVRLAGPDGTAGSYAIAAIFDTGFDAVDSRTVFLPLRDAQALFGLGKAVTAIGIKLDEVFEAPAIAERLRLQIPYEVESWTDVNARLLSALNAQSQSSNMIQAFTLIASGFAVASIMVMAVMSRLREIGILKAMGATSRQVRGVFSLQGMLLSLVGAVSGAILGGLMCYALSTIEVVNEATGTAAPIFPMDLSARTILAPVVMAVAVGLLASLYPASRAARINPIDVIRGQ